MNLKFMIFCFSDSKYERVSKTPSNITTYVNDWAKVTNNKRIY